MVPLRRQELITDCTDVMKRITQRLRARIALDRILLNLEKGEMPFLAEGHETNSILNSSLRRSMSNLSSFRSWREVSYDDIQKHDYMQIMIEENLVDPTTTAIYECRFQSLAQDDSNKHTLYAHVIIPANYPQARSLFLLKVTSTMPGNRTIEKTRLNNENIKVRRLRLILSTPILEIPRTLLSSVVEH